MTKVAMTDAMRSQRDQPGTLTVRTVGATGAVTEVAEISVVGHLAEASQAGHRLVATVTTVAGDAAVVVMRVAATEADSEVEGVEEVDLGVGPVAEEVGKSPLPETP